MTHTPGPWTVLHRPRLSTIHGPEGEHIADTGAWRDDEHAEMMANGNLIAAAPELVAALEELLDQLTGIGIPDWHGAEGLSLDQARATLAKAT